MKTLLLLMMTSTAIAQSNFKQQQLNFPRVKAAYEATWTNLQKDMKSASFKTGSRLYIAAYKNEGILELWLADKGQQQYRLFKKYNFCAHSGTLGPKLQEGDMQTPEGFYHINAFNPKSNFHLSLGVNYPNAVDLKRSGKKKPGGDIYIHGNCVTIGCIPLTDAKIDEVYVMAVEARNAGQEEIPVHIFPFKMTKANLDKFAIQYPAQKAFWTRIQAGYLHFEQHKTLPKVTQIKGEYLFK